MRAEERREALPEVDIDSPFGVISAGEVDPNTKLKTQVLSWWPDGLLVVPIPSRSPVLGWSVLLGTGYFFQPNKDDAKSPPSIVGGGVFVSENGSKALAAGSQLYLKEDKIRITAAGGYMDVNYRIYSNPEQGEFIDVKQRGGLALVGAKYAVWDNVFLGARWIGFRANTFARFGDNDSGIQDLDRNYILNTDNWASGIKIPLTYDTRDDQNFPRQGWNAELTYTSYNEAIGSDFDTEIYELFANYYHPFREADVLASRAYYKTVNGSPPFYLLSIFGTGADLRGYTPGRYIDRSMYAIQTEYRFKLMKKVYLAGFVGVGEVYGPISGFREIVNGDRQIRDGISTRPGDNLLPAGGLGLRYVLSERYKVSLRLDYAWGKDEGIYYLSVGEAF